MRKLLIVLYLMLLTHCDARDPTYAVEMKLPVNYTSSDGSASLRFLVYKLVNVAWLRYIMSRSSNETVEMWLLVGNLPRSWNGLTLEENAEISDALRRDAKQEICALARTILYTYVRRGMGKRNVMIHCDGDNGNNNDHVVDRYAVTLNLLGPSDNGTTEHGEPDRLDDHLLYLTNFRFNRTILITFEEPPYGQSRPNRLVTNRNVPWHCMNFVRYVRSDKHRKIDTTDLRYRYAHNVGHLLGIGHYVNVDGITTAERTIMSKIGLPVIRVQRNNRHDDEPTGKSVMYANTSDPIHAAQYITEQDLLAVRYIALNLDGLLEQAVRKILSIDMPQSAIDVFRKYGKLLL